MGDQISKDIIDLQDIEKVQYLKTLQADPQKYAAYINSKKDSLIKEVVLSKDSEFLKASGDMARFMDMDNNSHGILVRTGHLAASQDHIFNEQQRIIDTKKINDDLTRRQVEINDWYYENKRETLFVLQLILLTALTVVVLLTLKTYGFISEQGSDFILLFIILVALCTWLYRWYYTKYIRDRRFWNNRNFPAGEVPDPAPKCESGV